MAAAVTAPQTAAVIAALRARSGFSAEAVAAERVASFLALRARELGVAGAELAASRALADPAEFARLEAHFAPPETWLFRYSASFELLRAFARARSSRGVHALIVGAGGWCEPCSIAAALLDGMGDAQPTRVSVEAIDRNAAVFAGPPRFRGMDLRAGVPPFAARFFAADGDALRPAPDLLRVIRTRQLSAETQIDESRRAGERFDVIAFRNVAIYLDHASRNAIFAELARLLADDGVMLVGHAETTAAASATGLSPDPAPGTFALARANAAASVAPVARPEPARRAQHRREPSPDQPSPHTPSSHKPPPGVEPTAREPDDETRARSAIAAQPSDPRLYLTLARVLDAKGDRDGAREAVVRALYLDRNLEDALVLAAQLAAARGDGAEADHLRARAMRIHLERKRAEGGA
jgi:chemotaxis methyl-accepting protein methylase